MVILEGYPYQGKDKRGDFKHDVQHMQNTLFLINENFLDKMKDELVKGSGTACLRHLTPRFCDKPRAVGITTGWSKNTGGFKELDDFVRHAINLDFERIHALIKIHKFERVVFSCDTHDPTKIGCNIFKVDDTVLNYISNKLMRIPENVTALITTPSLASIDRKEQMVLLYAKLSDENSTLRWKLGAKRQRVIVV